MLIFSCVKPIVFEEHDIQISFKTINSLRSHPVNVKNKVDILNKSGVYKICCCSCPGAYIGQTSRFFKLRTSDHIRLINRYLNTDISNIFSSFANHILENNHSFNHNDKILCLHQCNNGIRLNLLEPVKITKLFKDVNSTCQNNLSIIPSSIIFNSIL